MLHLNRLKMKRDLQSNLHLQVDRERASLTSYSKLFQVVIHGAKMLSINAL